MNVVSGKVMANKLTFLEDRTQEKKRKNEIVEARGIRYPEKVHGVGGAPFTLTMCEHTSTLNKPRPFQVSHAF